MDVLLFDADGQDQTLPLADALHRELRERQLLWCDFTEAPRDPSALAQRFNLALDVQAALKHPTTQPALTRSDNHLAVQINAFRKTSIEADSTPLLLVAGPNFIITRHDGPIEFLEAFKTQIKGDTQLGQLDSAAFLAVLLTRHVESYFAEYGALEAQVDRLDEDILSRPASQRHLRRLVALRHQVSRLRHHLGQHRSVYVSLAAPDFALYAGDEPEKMLSELFGHFERAEVSIAGARDLILGSFDLYMTSTSQKTNDTMRVLTVAPVALGIVAAVAGVMGMNFQATLFKSGDVGFRDVLVGTALVIVLIVVLGRWRRWL